MHKAILFENLENNKVKCTACRHYCIIDKNKTGVCGVRLNKNKSLYLLVHSRPVSVSTDPIEKKPLYHFLPKTNILSIGTVGCNFGCDFCQNHDISQFTKNLLKIKDTEQNEESERNESRDGNVDTAELLKEKINSSSHNLPPKKIVSLCIQNNIPSIAYTYNEPGIFAEYIFDTAKLAKENNIKNVLVSNGYLSDESLNLLKKYIDAINIDLKSFSEDFYREHCKAKLAPVLDCIKKVKKLGIWLEITTLIIPRKNDSEKELKNIAEFIASVDKNIPWHISAFYPMYKMLSTHPTPPDTLLRAYDIGKKAGLNHVYVGNIRDIKHSSTYCPKCSSILIERDGYDVEIKNLKYGQCLVCNNKLEGVWNEN